MVPFASPLLNGEFNSAALVYVNSALTAATATLSSLGVKAGDLAIAVSPSGSMSSAGGAWSTISMGVNMPVLQWRRLTATDVAGAITPSSGSPANYLAIYKQAGSVALVANATFTSGASGTLSGYSPPSNHFGLFSVTHSLASSAGTGCSISAPATFGFRATQGSFVYNDGSGNHILNFQDRLSPPNQKYASQSFTLSWTAGDAGTKQGYVFELRAP